MTVRVRCGRGGAMAVIVAVVAASVAGCEQVGLPAGAAPATSAPVPGGQLGDAPPPRPGTPKGGGPTKFDCAGEGGETVRLLPADTGEIRQVMTNPCLPLAELSALVLGLVETDGQQSATAAANKKKFRVVLDQLGGRVFAANDVAECGYQTDRLAIGIYQQQEYRWSVGVVAVIRGDVGAGLDVGACYLVNQLPPWPDVVPYSVPDGPQWQMCGTFERSERDGETYTVLAAGDTDVMCDYLDDVG